MATATCPPKSPFREQPATAAELDVILRPSVPHRAAFITESLQLGRSVEAAQTAVVSHLLGAFNAKKAELFARTDGHHVAANWQPPPGMAARTNELKREFWTRDYSRFTTYEDLLSHMQAPHPGMGLTMPSAYKLANQVRPDLRLAFCNRDRH
jgi:hypothetical protein